MRIYTILDERPELWQGESVSRKEIARIAHDYVWDLFKMGDKMQQRAFWHDIYKLMDIVASYRDINAIRRSHKEAESTRIAEEAGRKASTLQILVRAIVGYLREYGGFVVQRQYVEQLYRDFEGYLDFMGVENWPDIVADDAANDFEGLRGLEEKATKWPKGFGEETAKAIFKELSDKGFIECEESDFVWYFGSAGKRASVEQPGKIKWKSLQNSFALLCMLCTKKMGETRCSWQTFLSIFETSYTAEQLKSAKKEICEGATPRDTRILERCINESIEGIIRV